MEFSINFSNFIKKYDIRDRIVYFKELIIKELYDKGIYYSNLFFK
jgi:hypothetical protein